MAVSEPLSLDRFFLHSVRSDMQVVIDPFDQFGEARQTGRIRNAGATEQDNAAFLMRLKQPLRNIRTISDELHVASLSMHRHNVIPWMTADLGGSLWIDGQNGVLVDTDPVLDEEVDELFAVDEGIAPE